MRPPAEPDMPHRDQGAIVECVYCKLVEPHLRGTPDCPACHGAAPRFRPMRMMDRETSGREILHHVTTTRWETDPARLRDQLLALLDMVDIYRFDLQEALIDALRDMFHENG